MNYFTEIATWILKCTFIAYYCVPPLRFPVSLGILRWGNASDQKLEVGERELRSPASYYSLTTAPAERKKFGELWSTNKKVIGTHPSGLFSRDYISALRGRWPLEFFYTH